MIVKLKQLLSDGYLHYKEGMLYPALKRREEKEKLKRLVGFFRRIEKEILLSDEIWCYPVSRSMEGMERISITNQ
ncbi:hypothetical protein [Peribacillus sp. ACCC06369]|uniref:hypothetical protein n=1 Tax=Peribacillus sp. ACCC06369 TaxID=3055860 RepID=UPI0025A24A8F|nr:hypothetical protein [Peribacillus sp. ACCC06369]MDM5358599.1 hypothetical protein [Peribacillus sp. ACCC06369]